MKGKVSWRLVYLLFIGMSRNELQGAAHGLSILENVKGVSLILSFATLSDMYSSYPRTSILIPHFFISMCLL